MDEIEKVKFKEKNKCKTYITKIKKKPKHSMLKENWWLRQMINSNEKRKTETIST